MTKRISRGLVRVCRRSEIDLFLKSYMKKSNLISKPIYQWEITTVDRVAPDVTSKLSQTFVHWRLMHPSALMKTNEDLAFAVIRLTVMSILTVENVTIPLHWMQPRSKTELLISLFYWFAHHDVFIELFTCDVDKCPYGDISRRGFAEGPHTAACSNRAEQGYVTAAKAKIAECLTETI